MSKKMKKAMKRAETISTMLCTLISINVVLIAVNLGANPLVSIMAGFMIFTSFCAGCFALVEAAFAGEDASSRGRAGHRTQLPAAIAPNVQIRVVPVSEEDASVK